MLSEKVPKLRFNNFTEQWQSLPLFKMGSLRNGITLNASHYRMGVPFINLLDVFGKTEINQPELFFADASEHDLETYNILAGDVLFVRSSVIKEGIGSTVVCNYDLLDTVYSGFLIRYRTKQHLLDKSFKKYCFNSTAFKKQIRSISTTSVNTNLNQTKLNKLILSFPTLTEQATIAHFLGLIDKKITLLEQKKQLLECYKRRAVQELLTQKKRFINENNQSYPIWKKLAFKDLMTQQRRRVEKPQKNYLSIGVKSFAKGTFSKFDVDPIENGAKYLFNVHCGDLIINRLFAWEGAIAFAKKGDHLAYVTNNFLMYKLNNQLILPEFFEYIIALSKFRIMLERISGLSDDRIKPLNKDKFLQLNWLIPCLEEQQKITYYLSKIDQKINLIQQKLNLTQQYKNRLLQDMFV